MASDGGASNPFGVRASAADGLDLTTAISVVIGKAPNDHKFTVHESLVTQHSGFFATKAEDRENQLPDYDDNKERLKWSIPLQADDPILFQMFARFLYSGKVYSKTKEDSIREQREHYDNEWPRLVLAWQLGDKLQSPSFKDAVVDTMCEKILQDKSYPTNQYKAVYQHTSMGAPLRRLVVDIAVWSWSAETFGKTTFHESWNQFFRDLALRQREVGKNGRKDPAPFKTPSCKYHEHGDNSPCYKTMF